LIFNLNDNYADWQNMKYTQKHQERKKYEPE